MRTLVTAVLWTCICLCGVSSAEIVIIDSDTHIDPAYSFPAAGIHVVDGVPGPTRVEIVAGGQVATASADPSAVSGHSLLLLNGGQIGGPVDVFQQGTLRIDAGGFHVPPDVFPLFDVTTMITVRDSGTVEIRGGELDLYGQFLPFQHGIDASGHSRVAVHGGRLTAWNGNTIQISDAVHLAITGGIVWNDDANAVFAAGASVVTITGGELTGGEGGAAVDMIERSQLQLSNATLLNREGSGVSVSGDATGWVQNANVSVSDGAAIAVFGNGRATVVSSRLSSDSSEAWVANHGDLRLVDNRGTERDFISIRTLHQSHVELIGNDFLNTDGTGLVLADRSVVDVFSGNLKVTDGDGISVRDDATLNLRGGLIVRTDEALEDRVDLNLSGRGNLHVYAWQPRLEGDRLLGIYRDGTPLDAKLLLQSVSPVILHDLIDVDFQPDGVIDGRDIDLLGGTVRNPPQNNFAPFDLDDSGALEFADIETLLHIWLGIDFGDSNLDGYFDPADLVTVFAAGTYDQIKLAGWESGDWNQDARFDSSDLILAFQTGKYLASHGLPTEVANVPEPVPPLGLVALTLAGWMRRRPRNQAARLTAACSV